MPLDHTFVLANVDIPEMEKHALVNIESNVVKNEIPQKFCKSRTVGLIVIVIHSIEQKLKKPCEAKEIDIQPPSSLTSRQVLINIISKPLHGSPTYPS